MPRSSTAAAASADFMRRANLAQAMLLWSNAEWEQAVTRWTDEYQQATLHDDGHASERTHLASRSALTQQAWGVALKLMPHVHTVEEAAATGYQLLKSASDITWRLLVDHRPASVSSAKLASAIMFEAADHADRSTLEAMLARGAALHDHDANKTTVLSTMASSFTRLPLAQLPSAVELFLECVARLPRDRWAPDDVFHVVAKVPTAAVIESLGSPLRPEHLCVATNQAIRYNRAPLVQQWLPQVIATAKEERRQKLAQRPATGVLKGAIPLAVAAMVDPGLLRWVIAETRAWCPRADLDKAFNQAADGRSWEDMDLLWPHVRAEEVFLHALGKAKPGSRDVLDWIMARQAPEHRVLPQGQRARDEFLAELPLTRARLEAEMREGQAIHRAPSRTSRRPRA